MTKNNSRKMTINNKKILYFGTIFLFLILYVGYRFSKRESLYSNGIIGSAYIYEINYGTPKGGNIVIKYYFFFEGFKHYGGIDSGLPYEIRYKLLDTYFPVLIDTTNIDNNVLLVDNKRWKNMKREMPDSLKWIKEYY